MFRRICILRQVFISDTSLADVVKIGQKVHFFPGVLLQECSCKGVMLSLPDLEGSKKDTCFGMF